MDDKRREQIRKEARGILDKFGKSLGSVKVADIRVSDHVKGSGVREFGKKCGLEFRERMFANAPNKKGDFIIAEKASW